MDPVEQTKKLREDYERALDAAESRRAAYHEAVLELHRSGKPLREIAKELGLSHQRVHQIVTGEAPRRRNLRKLAGGSAAVLALITAAIVAAVWVQSYQPLVMANMNVLPRGAFNTAGEKGQAAWVGYRKGIAGGPKRPMFSFTVQNSGRFTVRLEEPTGRYGPDLPVLRGWSSHLIMAPYTRVKDTNKFTSRFDHGYRWRQGPFGDYHPIDLAPGQIVKIAYIGVWHDCDIKVTSGVSSPPTSLPVSYSFLWKSATANIPFPGGLTIVPPDYHPNADCHHSPQHSRSPSQRRRSTST